MEKLKVTAAKIGLRVRAQKLRYVSENLNL